jgi:hypothetical protein
VIILEDPACEGHDPAYWDTVTRSGHTSRLGSVKIASGRIARSKQIAIAKMICEGCPVKAKCLMLGMSEEEGIWGGKLPDERLASRRF